MRAYNVSATVLAVFLSVFIVQSSVGQTASIQYPETPRGDYVDTYHGVEISDPYRWMEDLDSPELAVWLKKQDGVTGNFLAAGNADRIKKRLDEISSYATEGLPTHRNGRLFYTRVEANENFGRLVMKAVNGQKETVLLNLEEMNSDGRSGFINSYDPQGKFLTYRDRLGQTRYGSVRIFDIDRNKFLPEELEGFYSGRSNIAWVRDGSGFFYTRYPVPENTQSLLGLPQVYFHRLGTSQKEDRMIYERPDDSNLSFSLRVTADNEYLIFSGSYSGGNFLGLQDRMFYMPLSQKDADVVELFEDVDATFAFEGSNGGRFWIRTSHDAPSLRLVAVDVARPDPGNWDEVVPEKKHTLQSVSEIGDVLVLRYVKDARMIVNIVDHEGDLIKELDHVTPNIFGFSDDRTTNISYYGMSTFYRPSTYFKIDVRSGEGELYFQPELNHAADDMVTEQVFFESKDGTRVPMYLVHRKGIEMTGDNPVFMYAYGAWGWSAFPWQWHMIPWVEMGGIYAVPGIRGGGEYGEQWYAAGARHNKQRGIDDFIGAAEWLIENGYTSSAKLVANGGSASGVLPAAASNQRPDLFAASVINFPTLDKLRYIEFGSARSWVPEFGDPSIEEDFKALLEYSPLHNLKEGTCYPATWIQVGEEDDTTTPMHGYKYAAALQRIQSCSNPVLLKVAWGAGHSYGSTPEQRRQTQAEEIAFIANVLGLDVEM